jgi:hypothetical protein
MALSNAPRARLRSRVLQKLVASAIQHLNTLELDRVQLGKPTKRRIYYNQTSGTPSAISFRVSPEVSSRDVEFPDCFSGKTCTESAAHVRILRESSVGLVQPPSTVGTRTLICGQCRQLCQDILADERAHKSAGKKDYPDEPWRPVR